MYFSVISVWMILYLNGVGAKTNKNNEKYNRNALHLLFSSQMSENPNEISFDQTPLSKVLLSIEPFISNEDENSSKKKNRPYTEFDNTVVFLKPIPRKRILSRLFEKNNIKALAKIASESGKNSQYDAYCAFFYSADSQSGIFNLKFDSAFIHYFLLRLYYFLDLVSIKKTGIVMDGLLKNQNGFTPIDLLALPAEFANLEFGSERMALEIFNTVIRDTTLTETVISFIQILHNQIKNPDVVRDGKSLNYSTFTVYYKTLLKYLEKTLEIVQYNYQRKAQFVENTKKAIFLYVPSACQEPEKPGRDNPFHNHRKDPLVSDEIMFPINVDEYTNNKLLTKYLQ